MSSPEGGHTGIHFKCCKSSRKPKSRYVTDMDSMPSCSTATEPSPSLLRSFALSQHSLNISKTKRQLVHENIEKYCAMTGETSSTQELEAKDFDIAPSASSSLVASPASSPRVISPESSWGSESPMSFSRAGSPTLSYAMPESSSRVASPSYSSHAYLPEYPSSSRAASPVSSARATPPMSSPRATSPVLSERAAAYISTTLDALADSTSHDNLPTSKSLSSSSESSLRAASPAKTSGNSSLSPTICAPSSTSQATLHTSSPDTYSNAPVLNAESNCSPQLTNQGNSNSADEPTASSLNTATYPPT